MSERFESELDRLLAGRLDGDLTPSQTIRLEELLAADARARDGLRDLERVDRAVRACSARAPELDVNWSAFRAGVMARLCQQPVRQSRRFPLYRIFSIAAPAAAAATILVSLMLYWPTVRNAPGPVAQVLQPVIEVACNRPPEPVLSVSAGEIEVTYSRSVELERATAARDAAVQGAPSLAVASGSKVAAPAAPAPALEPFQL